MRPDKYRRDGTPYPEGDAGLFEWAYDMQDISKKIVKQSQIGPYFISTVWLGHDHSFLREGPPVIFETMVFLHDKDSGPLGQNDPLGLVGVEDYMERYSTEEEAIEGHAVACDLYQRKLLSGDHHLDETKEEKE